MLNFFCHVKQQKNVALKKIEQILFLAIDIFFPIPGQVVLLLLVLFGLTNIGTFLNLSCKNAASLKKCFW